MRNAVTLLTTLFWIWQLSAGTLRGVEADFTQIRTLKELDMRLTVTGFMRCEPGKRLKWAVKTPLPAVTLIEKERLTHCDISSGKTAVIDAAALPVLKVLNHAFTAWMSGDVDALKKDFTVTEIAPEKVLLSSNRPGFAFGKVELSFAAGRQAVEKIFITEKSGDTVEIRFSDLRFDPVWNENHWKPDLK